LARGVAEGAGHRIDLGLNLAAGTALELLGPWAEEVGVEPVARRQVVTDLERDFLLRRRGAGETEREPREREAAPEESVHELHCIPLFPPHERRDTCRHSTGGRRAGKRDARRRPRLALRPRRRATGTRVARRQKRWLALAPMK